MAERASTRQNGASVPQTLRKLLAAREAGVLLALIVMCVFLTLSSDAFLTSRNLLNVGRQVSLLGIMAIGMTFVLITAEVDLSVGSIYAISGLSTGMLIVEGWALIPALLAGLLIGSFIGLINGVLSTYGRLPSFITTLGMLSVARGVALLLTSVGILLTVPEVLGGINAVPVLGILLGLLGGFLSALHVVISNRVLRKQSRAEAATALNITGALLLILLLLPFRQPDLPAVTSAWLGLAGLATFGTLGSMFFFLAGLRRIGASQAAILSTFEPVLVLILSVLLLDEVLSPIQITGAALIILSVVVLQIPLQALLRRLRRARGGAAL
ncbi:MAG: EamA family transporter [Chloroflexota bacterium]